MKHYWFVGCAYAW